MKNRIILFAVILVLGGFTKLGFCQPPHPPGEGHGNTGNQPAAAAPVGEGLTILLTLGAAYAGKKIYRKRKVKDEN